MRQQRPYPALRVSAKGERSIKSGHPWIYAEELRPLSEPPADGALADVFAGSAWMGTGFYNARSKIALRLLSRNANDRFDAAFWARRVQYALTYRRTVMPGTDFDCCRLIHGESDQMPGLTVDRYGDLLSVQITSLGMDRVRDTVLAQVCTQLGAMGAAVRGVYLRNDLSLRTREGLALEKGWWDGCGHPDSPVTEIVENGVKYLVDLENGQKTGFFLDQKYNRQAAARLAEGKRVLDCFTHTGSFGLNAAMAGAAHVHSVDISPAAIELARANAARNGLSNIDFETGDVFALLTELWERRCRDYDYIILDPPAFTKSRDTAEQAQRGYKEINLRAMKLLPRGGYLATCSCSHFLTHAAFRRLLREAAWDAGVSLRQIEERQQAPDHPILWSVPETDYLKCFLFQVV